MSDLWTFSASSAPPFIHHSSLSPPFISSPPALCSPSPPGNHGHTHKVSSPLLSEIQVTSRHHVPPPQVSPRPVSHPQVSPHPVSHPQVSPRPVSHPQVSPHPVSHPQVSPRPVSHPQVTSPYFLYEPEEAPLRVPWSQVTSHPLPPPYITSPLPVPQPQCQAPDPALDPGLDDPTWSRGEPDISFLLNSCSFPCQNLAIPHLDQFGTGLSHHGDDAFLPSSMYQQGEDAWRPLLPPLQCGDIALGGWSSSPAEDTSSAQFFHSAGPQPFCSPNTPGPSPHYPPTISSPAPQMHHRFQEYDSYLAVCEPSQPRPHPTHQPRPHQSHQPRPQNQAELIQDQAGLLDRFSPPGGGQEVTARPPDLQAGPMWRPDCGGGGGRRGKGRGRGRGTGQAGVNQLQPGRSPDTLTSRLLCSVCNRDFKSLPALNGHMRSHSASRCSNKAPPSHAPPPQATPPVPLIIPVSVPVQTRGSALYRSLLRLETAASADRAVTRGDSGAHYTPPPMLCPLRAGPGLYRSVTTRRRQRAPAVQLHNTRGAPVATETASPPGTVASAINKPRINLGRGFQAEIPPLLVQKHPDSHNALLLWAPWDELERPVTQQRVEALLTMTRSSVVPGGGASPESTLHVLSECRGDFLLAVEKLLSTPELSDKKHTASQSWTAAERKLLLKSLQLHRKDFSRVQKAVQTKSLSQCVEFYYLWKKKLSLTIALPDANGQRSPKTA